MSSENIKTILLVEDEAIIALAEKRQLEKFGYRVKHVINGENAVDTILKDDSTIDLILMDIDLGSGIDGTKAAENILAHKDIPVVFLSSHTEPEVVEKTEKITSYGYVVKNTGITILDASIKMAIKLFNAKMEHKRAEETAKEHERFLNSVFENIPNMIFIKDALELRFVRFNKAGEKLLGIPRDEMLGKNDHDLFTKEQADFFTMKDRQVLKSGELYEIPEETIDTIAGQKILHTKKIPIKGADGKPAFLLGISEDITERIKSEKEHAEYLHFLESLDMVYKIRNRSDDLNQMMSDMLDAVLQVFECDRAFLLYPCDPAAKIWTVPMERNKPEYPGVFELGLNMKMDQDVAETFRILLSSDEPVMFGPGTEYLLPQEVAEEFGFKSFMSMAIHPRTGAPWQFGIHQCSNIRYWTPEDVRLFKEIGQIIADCLSTVLAYRELETSERRYRMAQEIGHVGNWEYSIQTSRFWVSDETKRIFGFNLEQLDFTIAEIEGCIPEREQVHQALVNLIKKSKEFNLVFEIHPRNSTKPRIVNSIAELQFDKDSKPIKVIGVIHDITRHKRAEDDFYSSLNP